MVFKELATRAFPQICRAVAPHPPLRLPASSVRGGARLRSTAPSDGPSRKTTPCHCASPSNSQVVHGTSWLTSFTQHFTHYFMALPSTKVPPLPRELMQGLPPVSPSANSAFMARHAAAVCDIGTVEVFAAHKPPRDPDPPHSDPPTPAERLQLMRHAFKSEHMETLLSHIRQRPSDYSGSTFRILVIPGQETLVSDWQAAFSPHGVNIHPMYFTQVPENAWTNYGKQNRGVSSTQEDLRKNIFPTENTIFWI